MLLRFYLKLTATTMIGAAAVDRAVQFSFDANLAVHEAGHAIVGVHFAQAGMRCQDGSRGCLHNTTPTLLQYATIRPCEKKGRRYAAETKLAVRWRNMSDHVIWRRDVPLTAGPTLRCDSQEETTVLALFRVAWYMGGRAAEVAFHIQGRARVVVRVEVQGMMRGFVS